jgi:CelD/BcsL family acetyltransferase involved in cellulose biosynthesis
VRVVVAASVEDLERLAPAWSALCDETDAPVLTRPFWCIPWARHLDGWRAHVVAVYRDDQLVAIGPFQLRSYGGIEVLRLLGHGLGTVSAVVVAAPEAADAVWAEALGSRRRFAQLADYRTDDLAGVIGLGPRPAEVVPHETCVAIDCTMPFAEYMQDRTKKLRENLRRAERSVASRGGFEVEVVRTPEEWHKVRQEVSDVYDAAETAKPRQHLLRGALGRFTDDLIQGAAAAGVLRLYMVRVAGVAASFGVVFAAGTDHSYWLTRFHPDNAGESIGVLLQREVIAGGFAEGARRIDLMIGDQTHKRRWTTTSYGTGNVFAASTRPMLAFGKLALEGRALTRRGRWAHRLAGFETG